MRLLLAAAILVTFAVPLANAHIIYCTDETSAGCRAITINVPIHAAIFEPPCLCVHSAPSLAMERFLP